MSHVAAAMLLFPVCLTLGLVAQQGVQEVKVDVGVHDAKTPPVKASVPGTPALDSNPWFEKARLELGTFFNDEKATGKFTFKNPSATEQKLTNIMGSCTCARAEFHIGDRVYVLDREPVANSLHRVVKQGGQEVKERVSHITIAPNESGEVGVQMDMHGVRGSKEATLDMQTSETSTPQLKLTWKATGAVFFEVTPPDVNLNEMTWSDKRDFQFEIASPLKEEFNVTGHEPLGPGVAINSMEKVMRNGRAVWVVKGSYGPGVDERNNGATITFLTDLQNKKVDARVIAFVKGPLTVDPSGFIALGHIPLSTSKSKSVKIVPTDDFDLQAVKIDLEDLQIPEGSRDKLVVSASKDGKALVIEIKIAEGMPRSTVRGKVKVSLNHPAAPLKEFLFNGFVR